MAFANVGAWIGNHRRAVTIGTAVSLVLTLLVGISMMVTPWWKSVNRNTYVAYFSNTNGIYTGDEVRILGVAVGTVEQIDPQPQAAKVTFTVDSQYPVPADVRAAINGLFQQLEYPSAYNADQFASALRKVGALIR